MVVIYYKNFFISNFLYLYFFKRESKIKTSFALMFEHFHLLFFLDWNRFSVDQDQVITINFLI